MTRTIINGIKFQTDSLKHQVYICLQQGLNITQMSQMLMLDSPSGIDAIKRTIRKIKRLESEVTHALNVEPTRIPENSEKILDIEMLQEGNNMLLKVKSSKEFEDYLAKTKELRMTENLWGQRKMGEFYVIKLIDNYLDDINKPVFHKGQINFAVLRMKGISNGLTIPINELLSEKQVQSGIKLLLSTYKNHYNQCIRNNKIHVKGEVLLA